MDLATASTEVGRAIADQEYNEYCLSIDSSVCFVLPSLLFPYPAVTVLPLCLEPICYSVPFVTAALYVQLICSQLNGLIAARTLISERRRGRVRPTAGFGQSWAVG